MPKPLLSLLLVMTQLLPWSGAPAYLCVEGDGSVCIDFGPAGCDCCECDRPATNAGASEHGGSRQVEQFSSLDAVWSDDCAACDCTHIQISQQQGPIVLSPMKVLQTSRLAITLAAVVPTLDLLRPGRNAALSLRALGSPNAMPNVRLLSVVLRC